MQWFLRQPGEMGFERLMKMSEKRQIGKRRVGGRFSQGERLYIHTTQEGWGLIPLGSLFTGHGFFRDGRAHIFHTFIAFGPLLFLPPNNFSCLLPDFGLNWINLSYNS